MKTINVRRVSRTAALTGIALIILTATTVAFVESFDGLYRFAQGHGLNGFWASVWPLQVDAFIIIGELTIFVGIVDRFNYRGKILAWLATLGGTVVSVVGNILHVQPDHATDLVWLGTAAVPPIAATAGLMIGLQVLKRVLRIDGTATVTVKVIRVKDAGNWALRPLDWTTLRVPEWAVNGLYPRTVTPAPIPAPRPSAASPAPATALPSVTPVNVPPAEARVSTPRPSPAPAAPVAASNGSHRGHPKYPAGLEALTGRELAPLIGMKNRILANAIIRDYREGMRP
jgi:hypothetical protein